MPRTLSLEHQLEPGARFVVGQHIVIGRRWAPAQVSEWRTRCAETKLAHRKVEHQRIGTQQIFLFRIANDADDLEIRRGVGAGAARVNLLMAKMIGVRRADS
jgi:hypothetical protein